MVTRIRRYAQIIDILWKYGFGIALEKAFPGKTRFRLPGTEQAQPDQSTVYERVRLALEELGPTFVKFGQIMSTRTEIFPRSSSPSSRNSRIMQNRCRSLKSSA